MTNQSTHTRHTPHKCSSYRLCKCHRASACPEGTCGCRCGGCPVAMSQDAAKNTTR